MPLGRSLTQIIKKQLSKYKPCILTYHGVVKDSLNVPVWSFIDEKKFKEQIKLLSENYNCISLNQLITDIRNNTIKPRSVVITFDDGFENNYSVAFPILKKYNVPATIFLTAGYINTNELIWPDKLLTILQIPDQSIYFQNEIHSTSTPDEKAKAFFAITRALKQLHPYQINTELERIVTENNINYENDVNEQTFRSIKIMNWAQAKEMQDSKLIDFGSHTITHTIVSRLSEQEAYNEINESKKIIENHLGPINLFAYPNGTLDDFTPINRQQAIDAGYTAICTAITGVTDKNSNLYDLKRITVSPSISMNNFIFSLDGGIALSEGGLVLNLFRKMRKFFSS